MAEQLKHMFFTTESIDALAKTIHEFYPEFDMERFKELIFDENWESKELKQRMHHTSICLHQTLPPDFQDTRKIRKKAAPYVKGFEAMTLPDYVETYGLDRWDLSLPALGYFTRFSSSEFAIRPFLDKNPAKAMEYMMTWAQDKNPMVRRLASEGCRPRLPWAMALPKFKKDPRPILPILEKLKDDPSETVRRSVANNLNDISRDNPELVLEICEQWQGKSQHTDRIVKHACRTLLKAGNKRAMMLFGYCDPSLISIGDLELDNPKPAMGEDIHFTFTLTADGPGKSSVRLEYAVYFMKANGKLAKKVFKITENSYAKGSHRFKRKHGFQDMTTRKHYPGEHRISIIVNGEEKASVSLELQPRI